MGAPNELQTKRMIAWWQLPLLMLVTDALQTQLPMMDEDGQKRAAACSGGRGYTNLPNWEILLTATLAADAILQQSNSALWGNLLGCCSDKPCCHTKNNEEEFANVIIIIAVWVQHDIASSCSPNPQASTDYKWEERSTCAFLSYNCSFLLEFDFGTRFSVFSEQESSRHAKLSSKSDKTNVFYLFFPTHVLSNTNVNKKITQQWRNDFHQ